MKNFEVAVDKLRALRLRMRKMKVYEKDMDEQFTHSSGKGGQNVNKVATCVQLFHPPTGIRVKCKKHRTQGLNRFLARSLLLDKIEQKVSRAQREIKGKIEKMRRQKRKRTTESKELMLAEKHHRSEKKDSRKKIAVEKVDEYC